MTKVLTPEDVAAIRRRARAPHVLALCDAYDAAQERERRLKAGLQKYGLHLYSDCLDKRRSCVCGLGALLADSKKEASHDQR